MASSGLMTLTEEVLEDADAAVAGDEEEDENDFTVPFVSFIGGRGVERTGAERAGVFFFSLIAIFPRCFFETWLSSKS